MQRRYDKAAYLETLLRGTAGAEMGGICCRDWRAQEDLADKESNSEEAAKVEVAMMQLREQIRKLLDKGYSVPFTGKILFHLLLTDKAPSQ